MSNRYFLEVAYNGSAFHGSQMQGDLPTVQFFIENTLHILLKQPVNTFGASRTDEGVHALCSFYHFDYGPDLLNQLRYKMNCLLPEDISVNAIYKCIGNPINARFDAVSRTYRYRIYTQKSPFKKNRAHYHPFKIDRNILVETAGVLKNYSQFESFSKRNTQTKTYICNIKESYWLETDDEIQFVVTANRFLRGMVRALVGTQLQVARSGKVADFIRIIEAKDCTMADFSVPGYGLYLEKIEYPVGTLQKVT